LSARIALVPALIALAVLATACGGHLSGVVDFDNTRDFDSYTRFAFLEDQKPLERAATDTRKQVRREIEEQLQAKGYSITTPAKAQIIVIYHVGNRTKARTSGMAGGAGREASLAIELRDPKSERTMWYGTVEQTWHDDMDVKERVHTAVSLLLDSYPPEGKDLRKGSESVQE